MRELSPLHEALLVLGLEDRIPLPEAVADMRSEGLVADERAAEAVSLALRDLLAADLIQVWSGPWSAATGSTTSMLRTSGRSSDLTLGSACCPSEASPVCWPDRGQLTVVLPGLPRGA